jgi:hypothetical protein
MPRMRVYGLAKQGYLNYAIAFIKGKKILYLFEPEQLVIKSLDKTERK